MEVRRDWEFELDVDDVLRSQGADPAVIRTRRPSLVDLATRALDSGRDLLDPAVVTRALPVTNARHNRVTLNGGATLSGPLITEHLGGAERVTVMLATVGHRLEEAADRQSTKDLAFALALDAVGSAAVDALTVTACNEVEQHAIAAGLQSSLPLSPGMVGWDVGTGQREIFSILDPALVDVTVSSGMEMRPLKSATTVIGIGADIAIKGVICDFCDMRDICRHRIA